MRTCPVCGRQYPDDVTVCPDDREPLGAVTITTATSTGDVDEGTVLRPKQARPLERPRFTEVRLGPPEPVGVPTGSVHRTDTPDRVYRERPLWPIWAAVAVLAVAGIALAIYYVTAGQSDLAKEVSTQITDARVAVADARARLESLPQDSPIRNKLLTLQQWDRELQNLEIGHDRTREVAARARDIAGQARSVGEEARVAGATIPTSPPPIQPAAPATAPTNTNESAVDPMAPKPEVTNEAQKPAAPPTVTPSTSAPPGETKTPTEPSTPGQSTGKEPDAKTPPSKVATPPPPPAPDEKKP